MGSILIRGAKLADPEKICCERLDLLCRNGVIEKIEKNIQDPADKTVDAQSLTLLPGLVDMHVHLRDPGLTYKEDVFTGCRAAAAGVRILAYDCAVTPDSLALRAPVEVRL